MSGPLRVVRYVNQLFGGAAPSIAGGLKDSGEAGTTGAPAAVLNAVNDALSPFGVFITEQQRVRAPQSSRR